MGVTCCTMKEQLDVLGVDANGLGDHLSRLRLPPGQKMTVMMFGMTGAGKSALGNLLAGHEYFVSGDDTASVTNKQSVMRYEAADESLIVLDTIGLGDTQIDQEKVVNSIRDSALSAPNGIDAMFFVLRNGRITDDAIARLIYVTEYLWGSECLLNLYVIVTYAPKYVSNTAEATTWIQRQNEINWRFRHIYSLVGNNPHRMIFVDNPDPEAGEPLARKRMEVSRTNVIRALLNHPREVIPPFTHQMMAKARELTEAAWTEVQRAEERVQQLQDAAAGTTVVVLNDTDNAEAADNEELVDELQAERQTTTEALELLEPEELGRQLEQARVDKREAEKAWQEELEKVKDTEEFQQAAVEIVEEATKAFETGCDAELEAANAASEEKAQGDSGLAASLQQLGGAIQASGAKGESPFEAMKRMLMTLKATMTKAVKPKPKKGSDEKKSNKVAAAVAEIDVAQPSVVPGSLEAATAAAAAAGGSNAATILGSSAKVSTKPERQTRDEVESTMDEVLLNLIRSINESPAQVFNKLDREATGSLSPMVFNNFLNQVLQNPSRIQVGGIWRRADANLDGKVDQKEFCELLAPPGENNILRGVFFDGTDGEWKMQKAKR